MVDAGNREVDRDMDRDVDVVVLGLGAGGEYAARKLADAGLAVVGVERDLVGGECPFWGCTPSKLLTHSAQVGDDWSRVARRIREANHDWNDHTHAEPLERAGVRVVRGHGRLAGPGRVEVTTDAGTEAYRARLGVVLNSGTEPAVPDVPGLAGTPYWTNREVMRQTAPPQTLLVLGAGPIGAELAQAFARFGTRVTVLEAGDRMLGPEEPEACEVMSAVFRREGIEVRTGVEVTAVRHGAGWFELDVDATTLTAEALLVATGRRMNLTDVGLGTVGLDPACERVQTDERMRAADRLWAVGDITGHGAYTHLSIYQAQVVLRDLLGEDGPWADYRAVSRVTFTDPEVGSVGLTEAQAREDGVRVAVGRADIARASRGWINEAEGIVKVVADADRGVLIGATVVAPYGGEVLGLLAAAVHAEIPVTTLRGMHFAYPTFHRAIATALADL
jgi:pyruvate/2-oxoglutarate dehydrogenase complex dihydrolipoamide dehydrogenase (E3) component